MKTLSSETRYAAKDNETEDCEHVLIASWDTIIEDLIDLILKSDCAKQRMTKSLNHSH